MEPKPVPGHDPDETARAVFAQNGQLRERETEDDAAMIRMREEMAREAQERTNRYAAAAKWTLSSGRVMGYPPMDLSLDLEGGQLRHGYDGFPMLHPGPTREERREIADTVCAAWQEWAEK